MDAETRAIDLHEALGIALDVIDSIRERHPEVLTKEQLELYYKVLGTFVGVPQ